MPVHAGSERKIYLCQRKKGKHGGGLGQTTGWIHRTSLKNKQVEFLGGLKYVKVDDEGLHVAMGKEGVAHVVPCDTVVVCAGQVSDAALEAPLKEAGVATFLIGGAHHAAELDAKGAIDQASAAHPTAPFYNAKMRREVHCYVFGGPGYGTGYT